MSRGSERGYAAAVHAVLADGAPHSRHELLAAVMRLVPPEHAIRARNYALKDPKRPVSRAAQIQIGARMIATDTLNGMRRSGLIVRDSDDNFRRADMTFASAS